MNLLKHSKLLHSVIDKIGLEGLEKIAKDKIILVEKPKPEPVPEPTLFLQGNLSRNVPNFELIPEVQFPSLIIRAPRSIIRTHKDGKNGELMKLVDPEIQLTGLPEFNIYGDVVLWRHKDQNEKSGVDGESVHEYLKENNVLSYHLGLSDLLAIQNAMSVEEFRNLYPVRLSIIIGWKSVAENHNHTRYVPYLNGNSIKLRVSWLPIKSTLFSVHPGLCFRKSIMAGNIAA